MGADSPPGPTRPPERRRILVVDDEPAIVEMLREHFAKAYAVDTALDGAEAVAAAGRRRPDVVLLDVNMPGINGVEIFKLLKQVIPTIRVIMVTANANNAVAADLLQQGIFSYVPKPFNFRYLDHLVALALEQGVSIDDRRR